MALDSTFWVAVSFFIFFGGLVYLKVPQKINEILNKLILDIKYEMDESEKLRSEAKMLLDNAQKKLDTAQSVSKEILDQAKKDSDRLIIELNDKFHKSSEIKKNSAQAKISQMKDAAIKDIRNASVKIAVEGKQLYKDNEWLKGTQFPGDHAVPCLNRASRCCRVCPGSNGIFDGIFGGGSSNLNKLRPPSGPGIGGNFNRRIGQLG